MDTDMLLKNESFHTSGLRSEDVRILKKKYGPNLTLYPKKQWYTVLLRQLATPFTYLLFFAACIAVLVHDLHTALITLTILTINSGFSFVQEYRAEQALQLLNAQVHLYVYVLRDSKKQQLLSRELVPGDIVFLEPGLLVPADVTLIESEGLLVNESALTGESLAVSKATNTSPEKQHCYLGTTIIAGSAKALVTATGSYTRYGTITQLTVQKKQESHFAVTIKKLSALFFGITVVTTLCVVLAHFFLQGLHSFETTLLFAIALALSMTPEALPVVITLALSQSAALLAQHHVLVKRLSAIEDLGDITILCTDKTGTLTHNTLVFADSFSINTQYDVVAIAAISDETPTIFEKSIQEKQPHHQTHFVAIRSFPFNSTTRTQSRIIQNTQTKKLYCVTKGALESVCTTHETNFLNVQHWESEKGALGQRVIGCAIQEVQTQTMPTSFGECIGVLAFEDPIKETSLKALETAQQLGITIKIITGDSAAVSHAVARALGLIKEEETVLTGQDLAQLSQPEFEQAVFSHAVFARITPEQKYEIIETLKKTAVVGYLGDGINDAPALKTAHVGIVVQEATDLAKSIADIILLKNDLHVIINGIALGRKTFANTIKYIKITLAGNVGNVLTLSIASFLLPFLPLLPLQILLVNLLSDIPMIAIGTDAIDTKELKRPSLYNTRDILRSTCVYGVLSSVTDALFFLLFYTLSAAAVQTYWFIDNVLSEIVFILALRTKKSWFTKPYPSFTLSSLLIATAALTLAIPYLSATSAAFGFIKPHAPLVFVIVLIALVYLVLLEYTKKWYTQRFNNQKAKK